MTESKGYLDCHQGPSCDWADRVTDAKARPPVSRSQTRDYLGGHVSARKKPEVVEETAGGAVLADSVVEPAIDPELDRVPAIAQEETDVADDPDSGDDENASVPAQRKGKGKLVTGAVLALAVAAGAVWAAGALGGSGTAGLPESVSDPAVVIAALEDGGIECSGTAISGDVATCNSTMAVRIFASPDEAEKWVTVLLKDPQTSSAIGWVRHGNVVVAAPLNGAPEISAALGTGSQIY